MLLLLLLQAQEGKLAPDEPRCMILNVTDGINACIQKLRRVRA
jgi:hypothetical protein